MTQISAPSHILQLLKSQPFHAPEVWKRYPFRNSGEASPYKPLQGVPPGIYACTSRNEWNNQSFLKQSACYKLVYFSFVECLQWFIYDVRGWWLIDRILFSFLFLDLDECKDKTHQCDVNANCTNIPGSYNCTCRPGYQGNGHICKGKTCW